MKKSYFVAAALAVVAVGGIIFYFEKKNKVEPVAKKEEVEEDGVEIIGKFAELIPEKIEFLLKVNELQSKLDIKGLDEEDPDEEQVMWRCGYLGTCVVLLCRDGIKHINNNGKDTHKCFDETGRVIRDILNGLESSSIPINPHHENADINTLGAYFKHIKIRSTTIEIIQLIVKNIKLVEFDIQQAM